MIIPSAGEYAIRSDFFKLPVWTGIRFRILGMGTIFEDLLRRFNEDNNEEAGEHWTPRDAVELMAKLDQTGFTSD